MIKCWNGILCGKQFSFTCVESFSGNKPWIKSHLGEKLSCRHFTCAQHFPLLAEIKQECFVLHLLIVCCRIFIPWLPPWSQQDYWCRSEQSSNPHDKVMLGKKWCCAISLSRQRPQEQNPCVASTGPWAPPAQRQRTVPGGSCTSWGSATPNEKPTAAVALTETTFGGAKDLCVVLKPHDWARFPTWKGLLLVTRDIFFSIYFYLFLFSPWNALPEALCIKLHPYLLQDRKQMISTFLREERWEIFEAGPILISFPPFSFRKGTKICQVISSLCMCIAEGQNPSPPTAS